MSRYQFRPWREGDDAELLQVFAGPQGPAQEQLRSAFAPAADAPWRRCIVAEDQSIPVAAAVIYESFLHPTRLWAYLEVAPDHRKQGLGAELLEILRLEASQFPGEVTALRSKLDAGADQDSHASHMETPGEKFARAQGFHLADRSSMQLLSSGALPLPALAREESAGSNLAGDNSDSADPGPVQELATGSVELSDVVGRYYASVHPWDPSENLSIGKVQQYFLADAHGAVVLRSEDKAGGYGPIRAFAVSYGPRPVSNMPLHEASAAEASGAQELAAEVFLGHDPDLSPDQAKEAVSDLLAVISYQYPVILELSEAMPVLRAVLEPLKTRGFVRRLGQETLVFVDG